MANSKPVVALSYEQLLDRVGELEAEASASREREASLKLENARLKDLAMEDDLTGLPNKKAFKQRFPEVHALAKRGQSSFLLMLDGDGIKSVNDHHGHLAGDAAIQWMAQKLVDNVRQSDFLCRFGGDEFAIFLLSTSSQEGAEKAKVHLQATFDEEPFEYEGIEIQLGISIGIQKIDGSMSQESVFKEADKAMYEDKKNRKAANAA